MKKLYSAIVLLLIIGILSTAVLLILSPDIIPAHYNTAGQVDRYGSKYEMLIFPGFALLMAAIMLSVQLYSGKKGMPESEQKILLYTTIFSVILFDALGLFFGILAIRDPSGTAELKPDGIIRLVGILTGGLLMGFGNLMPKARRNAFFGLRTKWSMKNDEVWRKSQRFGGISSVICGLLTVLFAVILPGGCFLPVMTALVALWLLVCVLVSRRFSKTSAPA